MLPSRLLSLAIGAVLGVFGATSAAVAAPKVVVSIKPIHSLIAGVMEGVGEPDVIVAGSASPRAYSLSAADAERLDSADLVFWIGPIFESFLVQPLTALPERVEAVELDRIPGIALLPRREHWVLEPEVGDRASGKAAPATEQDGHLWLDPANAKAIVHFAVERLSARDPANAARYAANGATLAQRLDSLDGELSRRIESVRGVPFVVLRDNVQYFDRHYGLDAVGSLIDDQPVPPSAKRLEALRAKVRQLGVRCVFSEPFAPGLAQAVIAGTRSGTDVLDPEGVRLRPGSYVYFTLMRALAATIATCLARMS
jgi:zinc transport system substrate-binding protein